jgi:serine/threonine protein kinase
MADLPFPPLQTYVHDYLLRYKIAEKASPANFMPSVHYYAHSVDDAVVVIKCCYVTERNRAHVEGEVRAMGEARSIWTVPLIDAFIIELDGQRYSCVAMPYYASVWDVIHVEGDEGMCSNLCFDVAQALAALHARRWWHRDVNKGNVFLGCYTVDGGYEVHAFLGDFGLAHCAADGAPPPVAGTQGYLAPELIAHAQCTLPFSPQTAKRSTYGRSASSCTSCSRTGSRSGATRRSQSTPRARARSASPTD